MPPSYQWVGDDELGHLPFPRTSPSSPVTNPLSWICCPWRSLPLHLEAAGLCQTPDSCGLAPSVHQEQEFHPTHTAAYKSSNSHSEDWARSWPTSSSLSFRSWVSSRRDRVTGMLCAGRNNKPSICLKRKGGSGSFTSCKGGKEEANRTNMMYFKYSFLPKYVLSPFPCLWPCFSRLE